MNQIVNKFVKILNVQISPLSIEEIFDQIDSYIVAGDKGRIIGYSNLHGLYIAIENKDIQDFYKKSDINYVDGLPLIWIANSFGHKLTNDKRITFLDVAINFLKHCNQKGYKVLWIGGTEKSITKGMVNIKAKVPEVTLQGVNGFKNDEEYLMAIDFFKPNVIILGLGMPRQEQWVLRNVKKANVNVVWCVGATIDYISGEIYSPPRWSGKIGLEWAFRFLSEPTRMFPRYFIEPFTIFSRLLKDKNNKI